MTDSFRDDQFGQTWEKDFDTTIDKFKEFVHSSKTRTAYKRLRLFPINYQTQNNYDSVIIDFRLFSKAYIMLKNTHTTNALKYKIEGYIDPSLLETIKSETVVNAETAATSEEITKAYSFIKVSVKSNTSDAPATLLAFACVKT